MKFYSDPLPSKAQQVLHLFNKLSLFIFSFYNVI